MCGLLLLRLMELSLFVMQLGAVEVLLFLSTVTSTLGPLGGVLWLSWARSEGTQSLECVSAV